MRIVLKTVLLFILAIIIATLCSYGPGHVIMFISGYRLDLSLTTLILCILVIYVVLYYLSAVLGSIYHIPSGFRHYRHKRSLIKSRNYFNIAATNYFFSEYKLAYNNALKSISQDISINDKFPVLLLALDAIHEMDDNDKNESGKIDRLLRKLSSTVERRYIYEKLTKVNKTKNNRFYSEILTKLTMQNHSLLSKA